MTAIKIGDRVEGFQGKGVIICIKDYNGVMLYYVKHDKHSNNLHNCDGMCEKGYGWKYLKGDGFKKIYESNAMKLFID